VTADSGKGPKSVTFARNGRSRCAGMTGHDAGITGHVRPEYPRGTHRVKIVDSTLYFFIDNCNAEEVMSEIPHPDRAIEDANQLRLDGLS
jgi:hypothetical protein